MNVQVLCFRIRELALYRRLQTDRKKSERRVKGWTDRQANAIAKAEKTSAKERHLAKGVWISGVSGGQTC